MNVHSLELRFLRIIVLKSLQFIFEHEGIVVHEFGFAEVLAALVSFQLLLFMDDLLHGGHVRMIVIISHRNHRRVGQPPAEAPSADLTVEPREGGAAHALLREDVRVFRQDL